MPIALLVVGSMLLVTAMRGSTTALGVQLKKDLLGDGQDGGFIVWLVIIAILTGIGTIGSNYGRKDVQHLTQLFMLVVIVALVLRAPNVFQQFVTQIKGAPVSPAIDVGVNVANADSAGGKSNGALGYVAMGANVVANVYTGGMAGSAAGDMIVGVAGDNTGNASAKAKLGTQ